ncbi:hypothetical protein [Nocardia ninae]|nr:hypothetical protein [Nocardia ninae]
MSRSQYVTVQAGPGGVELRVMPPSYPVRWWGPCRAGHRGVES